MTLIKCCTCGREISDRNKFCSNCGTSIEDIKKTTIQEKKIDKKTNRW